MLLGRRAKPQWRLESGPGYDLRQYQGGRPTGLVAVTAWDHNELGRPPGAVGPDVWLIRHGSRLVVEEHRLGAVRLQIPLRSCVKACLTDEPGLPGAALIRLTLVVRVGRAATFTLPLWFLPQAHVFLRDLVAEILAQTKPKPPPPRPREAPALPLLEVGRAPDHPDWVVFRPADDGVLVERQERPVEERR
jgi:hypothetical protein